MGGHTCQKGLPWEPLVLAGPLMINMNRRLEPGGAGLSPQLLDTLRKGITSSSAGLGSLLKVSQKFPRVQEGSRADRAQLQSTHLACQVFGPIACSQVNTEKSVLEAHHFLCCLKKDKLKSYTSIIHFPFTFLYFEKAS